MNKHRFGKSALSILLVAIMVFAILPPLELRVEALVESDMQKVFSGPRGTIPPSGTSDYSDCFTYYAAWDVNSSVANSSPAAEWEIRKNGNEEQHIVKAPGTGSYSKAVTAATYEAQKPMTVTLTLSLNAGTYYYLGTRVVYNGSSSWTGIMPSHTSSMHSNWTTNSKYQQAETTHTTEEYTIKLAAGEVLVFAVRAGSEDEVHNGGAYGTLNIKSVEVKGEGYDFTIKPSDDAYTQEILNKLLNKKTLDTRITIHNQTTNETVASLYKSTEKSYTGKFAEGTELYITIYGVNKIEDSVSYHYYPDAVLDNNNVEIRGSDLTSESISFSVTITKDTTLTYSYKPLLVGCTVKNLTSNVASVTVSQATNPKNGSSYMTVAGGSTVKVPLDLNGYYDENGDSTIHFEATFNDGYNASDYNILWTYYKTGGVQQTSTSASWSIARDQLDASQSVTVAFTKKSFGVSAEVDSGYTGGTATVKPPTVEINGTATFTATANTGYKFIGWVDASGNPVSTANPYNPTITGPLTLYAQFQKLTYTVSATVDADCTGMGTVTVSSSSVGHGDQVTFIATANTGYKFIGWYQGNTCVNTSATYMQEIQQQTDLVAKFEKVNVTVTVGGRSNGTVTITGDDINYTVSNSTEQQITDWMNKEITLIAKGDEHFNFVGWMINGQSISANESLTIKLGDYSGKYIYPEWKAAESATVVFRPATNGTYFVNGTEITDYQSGKYYAAIEVSAQAAAGFRFVAWKDAQGNTLSNVATTTFSLAAVDGLTIHPEFISVYETVELPGVLGGSYTITPITEGDSTEPMTIGSNGGTFTGIYGNSYKITANPDSEYVFKQWLTVNGDFFSSETEVVITNFSSTGTFAKPVFAEKYVIHTLPGIANGSYTLTSADGSHSVTVKNEAVTENFLRDTAYTLIITLDYEYRFNGWFDSADKVLSYETTYSVINFHSPVFPKIEYVGIVQSLPGTTNGSYTVTDETTGETLATVKGDDTRFVGRTDRYYTLTATPADGYHFVGWADQTGAIISTNIIYVSFKASGADTLSPVFASDEVTMFFPAVPGGSYTVSGEDKTYTITEDTYITGNYNAQYTVTISDSLETYYEFVYWVDGNNNKIAEGDSYPFKLDANRIIKPFYGYYGSAITLNPVQGPGSYQLIEINGESSTVKATITNEAGSLQLEKTYTYQLVATAQAGYKFAAWKSSDGTTVSREATYETKALPKDVYAVFVKEDSAVYSVNGEYYDYFDKALEAANADTKTKTVIVEESGTIYGSQGQTEFSIPKYVKVIVPHREDITRINYASDDHPMACQSFRPTYDNSTGIMATPEDGYTTLKLTVPAGNKIYVDNQCTFAVGGTLSGSGAPADGEEHADVYLAEGAEIVVGGEGEGYLSVCGFIYGPGSVTVKENGKMYVLFAIHDFRGGGYTVGAAAGLVEDSGFEYKLPDLVNGGYLKQMPFSRYSLSSVQSKQTIEYGGTLYGYADMYAGGQNNKTTICLIGSQDYSLFRLKSENATATITYDPDQNLGGNNKIGRTKIELNGETALDQFRLTLVITAGIGIDIKSSAVVFPIPYNFEITVASGNFTTLNTIQLLPGSTIRVNEGATMNVNGTLLVYDGFRDWASVAGVTLGTSNRTAVLNEAPYNTTYKDVNFSGFNKAGAVSRYPSTEALQAAKLSGGAELIVNGTLNLNSGSKFGGIVQSTSNTGKIVVSNGANLSATAQMGGTGFWQYRISQAGFAYALAGATVRTLNAQVLGADGTRTNLVAGKTYYSSAKEGAIDSYTYTLHYAGNTTQTWSESKTEEVNIPMQGVWCEHATWTAATCTTPKTCSVCGATEGEALGHKYDAVVTDPTCTEAGYTTHTCSACGDTYKDSDVAAKGHTPTEAVEENRVESTCTVAGSYDEVVYCSECNAELSRETKALELAAHTEGAVVVENEKAATCTAEGSYDNVVYCTVCNAELSRNTVTVEKIAHTPAEAEEENRVESTCTVAGSYDVVVYCSECGEELSRTTKALELAAHTAGETVVVNKVDATCTAEGSYDNVVYCTECGEELSREAITLDKLAHTPADAVEENRVESTCTAAGSYDEVVYCSVCNTELSREAKALELAAHTAGEVVVENEKAATCIAKGSYDNVVYCTVCNAELDRDTIIVNVTDHTYVDGACTGCGAKDPDFESAGATITGTVKANNKNIQPVIKLFVDGVEKYTAADIELTASGTWSFTFDNVAAGTYDLVITKDSHLTYTLTGVQVTDQPLDLNAHSNAAISTITMLCGDIDGNGWINSTDLGIILQGQNYGKQTTADGANALADLDGNGWINSTDLGIVLQGQHYGKGTTAVSFTQ